MEQNNKDQKFGQQPGKKAEMPAAPRSTTRPEIDLPLKGGRSDADLSQKNQTVKKDDVRREDRNDYEKSSR